MSSPERLPDLSGRRTCQQNYIFRGDPGVLLGWHGVDTGRLSRLCERFLRQAVTRARLSAVLGDGDQFGCRGGRTARGQFLPLLFGAVRMSGGLPLAGASTRRYSSMSRVASGERQAVSRVRKRP